MEGGREWSPHGFGNLLEGAGPDRSLVLVVFSAEAASASSVVAALVRVAAVLLPCLGSSGGATATLPVALMAAG